MIFLEQSIAGVFQIELEKREDSRGFFARLFCEEEYEKNGLCSRFVQHNVGFSPKRGTLRGMHFQHPPHQEAKVVRCTMGRIFDVAVDLRPNSKTFQKWFGQELSAKNRRMLYIPEGCAHGYLTLEENSEVVYYTSHQYAPSSASGIRYDDPMIGIAWPGDIECISDADNAWPLMQG